MAWFRCYDNSDVIATLIMTNFHLLWWQFFLMFVYGDVVYAQTWHWPWKTVSSHLHTPVRPMLLQYGLVSFGLFCKNLGHLGQFFGQMVYRPPWQKIPRTPMVSTDISRLRQTSWTNMQPRKQTLHVKPSVETIAETWFSGKNYPMNEFSNSSGWPTRYRLQ